MACGPGKVRLPKTRGRGGHAPHGQGIHFCPHLPGWWALCWPWGFEPAWGPQGPSWLFGLIWAPGASADPSVGDCVQWHLGWFLAHSAPTSPPLTPCFQPYCLSSSQQEQSSLVSSSQDTLLPILSIINTYSFLKLSIFHCEMNHNDKNCS